MDSEDQQPKSKIHSLDALAKEFEDYLEETGLLENLRNILGVVYDMDERPADPLEFMRTNLTDTIIERERLAALQEKNLLVLDQIVKLQEKIIEMEKEIDKFQPNEQPQD